MNKLPYDNYRPADFILRDWLALDRTVLANERTFLAYCRTSLTLILAGLTFIRFFGHEAWAATGYGFIIFGLVVFTYGYRRYRHMLGHYSSLTIIEDEELAKRLDAQAGRPAMQSVK